MLDRLASAACHSQDGRVVVADWLISDLAAYARRLEVTLQATAGATTGSA